jgi:hypothetical protein
MRTTTSTCRRLTLAVGLALACAALAGCTSTAPSTGSAASPSETDQQAYLRWEADVKSCIAGQGFDLPDGPEAPDFGSRQDEYELAEEHCVDQVGLPPGADRGDSAEREAAGREGDAAERKCYSDAGYTDADLGDDPDVVAPPDSASDELVGSCGDAWVAAYEKALAR